MTLPQNKMYALRHGVNGRIWRLEGVRWLWDSPTQLTEAWNDMKVLGLLESDINEHKIVTILLEETQS